MQFNKTYVDRFEEMYRRTIWAFNVRQITKHNLDADKGYFSYRLKVNHLTDMSSNEINEKLTGLAYEEFTDSNVLVFESNASSSALWLPTEVDWRTEGYVTAVKSQGGCGSCYAFATTGALEGQHFKKSGRLVSLSEQNIIDCTNNDYYRNKGCHGGLMDRAYKYVIDNKGIDTEQSYPYAAMAQRCTFSRETVGAIESSYVQVTRSEEILQIAVASVGPIAVGIEAKHSTFKFYSDGIYDNSYCGSKLNHAMLIVGYGTDSTGQDYWLVKNSWGTGWGEDGYVRMARNKGNQCGIANLASYPVV